MTLTKGDVPPGTTTGFSVTVAAPARAANTASSIAHRGKDPKEIFFTACSPDFILAFLPFVTLTRPQPGDSIQNPDWLRSLGPSLTQPASLGRPTHAPIINCRQAQGSPKTAAMA